MAMKSEQVLLSKRVEAESRARRLSAYAPAGNVPAGKGDFKGVPEGNAPEGNVLKGNEPVAGMPAAFAAASQKELRDALGMGGKGIPSVL